jgi:hypothetical protein
MSLFCVDEIDLARGEGDWANMQAVVRKSFAALFNVVEKQQQQITDLTETVSKLKREIEKKPDRGEMNTQIKQNITDARGVLAPDVLRRGDLTAVHSLLVDVKADVERKASIRYVDDACRRKIDKSDVTMRPLLQNTEHISKLAVDISQLRQSVERYDQIPGQITEIKAKAASKDDVKNLLSRIDHLAVTISERPDSESVLAMLSEKAGIKEIDGRVDIILNHRHDDTKAEVESLERMLLDHEHRLSTVEYSEYRKPSPPAPASKQQSSKVSRQSETARQLSKYGKIIDHNVANVTGAHMSSVYESKRAAQIDCMQQKLDDTSDIVHQQEKLLSDQKHRIQRLEGNVMKLADDGKGHQSAQRNDITDLQHRMRELGGSTVSTLDDIESRLSSLHHKVEDGLFAPLNRRVEAVEFKSEAFNSALSSLQEDVQENNGLVTASATQIKKIESAVTAFNEGVLTDVKKELHRLKSDRATASAASDKSAKRFNDKQQEMELRMHDMDATTKAQLDISASKFSSLGDLAVTVRALKQTVKTVIETTLQQNKKLQSFESSDKGKGSSDDSLRTQLAIDINSRLHNCEVAVGKLADLEVRSALACQSLSTLEHDMKETKTLTNNFQVQFSEVIL